MGNSVREIKFRAWDAAMQCLETDVQKWGMFPEVVKNPARFKLMQYTGLKDKNGVEIYEGDIIKFTMPDDEFELGVVRFSDGGYWTSQLEGYQEDLLSDELVSKALTCRVIGNIYKNPDLLEAGLAIDKTKEVRQ